MDNLFGMSSGERNKMKTLSWAIFRGLLTGSLAINAGFIVMLIRPSFAMHYVILTGIITAIANFIIELLVENRMKTENK